LNDINIVLKVAKITMSEPITKKQEEELRSMSEFAFNALTSKGLTLENQKKVTLLFGKDGIKSMHLSTLVEMMSKISAKTSELRKAHTSKTDLTSEAVQQEFMDIIRHYYLLSHVSNHFPEIITLFTPATFLEFLSLMVPPKRTLDKDSSNSDHQASDLATSNIALFRAMHIEITSLKLADFLNGETITVFSGFHGNGIATNSILFSLTIAGAIITRVVANDITKYGVGQRFPAPCTMVQCSFDQMSPGDIGLLCGTSVKTIVISLIDCQPNTDGYDMRGVNNMIKILSQVAQRVIIIIGGEIGAGSFSNYFAAFFLNHPLVRLITHQLVYQRRDCAGSRSFMTAEILKSESDNFDLRQLIVPNRRNLSMLDNTPFSSLPYSEEVKSNSSEFRKMHISLTSPEAVDAFEASNTHPMQTVHKCVVCAEVSTLCCAVCKTTYYCRREHQAQDWKAHKKSHVGGKK
jgi:hypothetical protein